MAILLSVLMLTAMLPMTVAAADGDTYFSTDYADNAAFFAAVAKGEPGETYIVTAPPLAKMIYVSDLYVPDGVSLIFYMDPGVTFNSYGVVDNYGAISVESATGWIMDEVFVYGTLNNYGSFTTDRPTTFENCLVNNYGVITVDYFLLRLRGCMIKDYGGTINARIYNAEIDALIYVYVLADISELNAALAEAALLNEAGYTAETWANLDTAVIIGTNRASRDGWVSQLTGQSGVDDATAAIVAAIAALEVYDPCADGHDYGDWAMTTPATCTEPGLETRICANDSSHMETRAIAANGHSYVGVVTPMTPESDGFTTYTCSVCGDSYIGDYVDAVPHNWEIVEIVTPTCLDMGYTVYFDYYWNVERIDDYTNALGHDYVLTAKTSNANLQNSSTVTITVEGTCALCGDMQVMASASIKLKQNGTQTVTVGGYAVTVVVNGNNKITNIYVGALSGSGGNQNSQGNQNQQ
jgi:hypothetical protein